MQLQEEWSVDGEVLVFPFCCRFRPHTRERRLVVGADVVVHRGRQETGCGTDRQRTLGQVWTSLLLQVVIALLACCFNRLLCFNNSSLNLLKSTKPETDSMAHPSTQKSQSLLISTKAKYVSWAFTFIHFSSSPPHCLPLVLILTSPLWEAQIVTAVNVPTDSCRSFPCSHRDAP